MSGHVIGSDDGVRKRLSDWHTGAAILAAPVFWLALYLAVRPPMDLDWPLHFPWVFLLPVLLIPVVEEYVFRGLIQGWLLKRLPGRRVGPVSLANILTSVAFCIPHFFRTDPVWAASVFFPSLVFGHFRERHGGLATPIGLHVFYNAGYFWLFASIG